MNDSRTDSHHAARRRRRAVLAVTDVSRCVDDRLAARAQRLTEMRGKLRASGRRRIARTLNWLRRFVLNDAPGNVTLDAGLSQGLPWLGADHDAANISRTDAHAQFTKFDATATWMVPLPKLGGAALAYRGTIGGQYTNVALYGTDQLYLGGMDTIRGFYSRNELAWVSVPVWHDWRVEPYVFLDAGKASLVATPGFATLAGGGAGLRAQWQWHRQQFSAEGLVGRRLCRPAASGPKSTLALGTINWNF